jgi:hypothetical protein
LSSVTDSLTNESRRREIYSCECSSSLFATFDDSVLFDTRYLT